MTHKFRLAPLAFLLIMLSPNVYADSQSAVRDHLRVLWLDRAVSMRMYIVSVAGDLPDVDIATQRLLRDQEHIGSAVADYYGSDVGVELTALMKEHVLIAGELTSSAKSGDAAKMNDAHERWYQSADDIASYLHDVNPHDLVASELEALMRMDVDQTFAEVTHRLQGNYEADALDYDDIVQNMLVIADTLSDGIVAQFPDKLSGGRSAPPPQSGSLR